MITVHYYDTASSPAHPSVFLAGPTTDQAGGEWTSSWEGHKMSAWRARACEELSKLGFTGTVIVPEFSTPGEFRALSAKTWPNPPQGPRSAPLLWEDDALAKATVVVFWADLGLDGPNRGLSARPEASELFFRAMLPEGAWTWRIRNLVFGAPLGAKKVGRFLGFADDQGRPVWRTLAEVARAVMALVEPPR
jgi:hypothetical protein